MFVIIVKYKKSLSEIEKHLEAHRALLKKNFAEKKLIAAGPQDPRIGGIILSCHSNRQEVEEFINSDPFKQNDLADYEIIGWNPNLAQQDREFLMSKFTTTI